MSQLISLAERTLTDVWYPFTQHSGLLPEDVTVIDARSGEDMLVFKPGDKQGLDSRIEAQYDACASWWTQVSYNPVKPLQNLKGDRALSADFGVWQAVIRSLSGAKLPDACAIYLLTWSACSIGKLWRGGMGHKVLRIDA